MATKKPRRAHCIGCGVTFDKMHLMINHRRTERCGGRFLPEEERELFDNYRASNQMFVKTGFTAYYHAGRSFLVRFNAKRRLRLRG